MEMRFEKFVIAMLKAIYEKQTLVYCNYCRGDGSDCPQCYGFGAVPNTTFTEISKKLEKK